MGTQATVCFYEKLHAMQTVKTEQEYIDSLIYSIPSTPDRTAFITGKQTDNPIKHLIHSAKTLENAGATLLTMLCITAHHFYDELAKTVRIPFLSIPIETAKYASDLGINKVGLLATDGTLHRGVFGNVFAANGIDVIFPSAAAQATLMKLIYKVKLGSPIAFETIEEIAEDLLKIGVEAIVLGCTELCIMPSKIHNSNIPPFTFINSLDVLAKASYDLLSVYQPPRRQVQ